MSNNPNEVFYNLFLALDDTVLKEYRNFEAGLVEGPSELSIKALQDYCKMFDQQSNALSEMELYYE